MAASKTSIDLLAHFDARVESHSLSEHGVSRYGALWVLKWAAALGIIVLATNVLLQFAYGLAAERTLLNAARAGALEATLPRATYESIEAVVRRRLAGRSLSIADVRIAIQHNGFPLPRVFRLLGDDRVSVTLSVPANAALPGWLRAAMFWNGGSFIEATAERQVPSRRLRMAAIN
jgi:hypothetical protein